MAIDEKDVIDTQALAESIERVGEAYDKARRAILAELKAVDDDVAEACRARDYVRAERKLKRIAEVFRARGFPGEAERYLRRAADIHDVGVLAKRTAKRARKHGGRK